jgi:cerevisin
MMLTKKFLLVAAIFLSSATAAPYNTYDSNIAPLVSSDSAQVIPDSYIVVFKKHVEKEQVTYHHSCIHNYITEEKRSLSKRGLLEDLISGIKHTFNFKNFQGYSGKFSNEILEKIRRSDEVAYVEKDQVVYATEIDTQSGAPWGLARISHRETLTMRTYDKYLHDPLGGEGVTIYVIDTGINIEHEQFEGRAEWGKTVPQNDLDEDGNGHGTHVAGTIASARYGVSKRAKVVAIKVLRSNGSGTMSDVIKGVEYAAQLHLNEKERAKKEGRIFKGSGANMSLGGGKSQTLDSAVNGAVSLGLNFAVAAGNDNRDACDYSPAAAENAITVGASTIEDERAWFSNVGPCVDVFAPGKDIQSTWIGSRTATNIISGTSMASPHVAGLIAYFLSLEPEDSSEFFSTELTPKELKDKIIKLSTSNVIGNVPYDTPNLLVYNNNNKDIK